MKLLKRKNFQSLIYAIFISLPILSILPSTIYFAFNHNAQEYTQNEVVETYEYETNEVNSVDDLVVGNIYKYDINSQNYAEGYYLRSNAIIIINEDTILTDKIFNNNQLIFRITNTNTYIYYENENAVWNNMTDYPNDVLTRPYTFYFVYQTYTIRSGYLFNIQYVSASDYLGEKNVEVIESDMNPLTAFDNSIDKFVSENDFGRIDFFTFFSSLFLTPTSMNNLYVHFINWYLNYILYISLAYLLFSVLLWFVNFGRRLLEDSQNINVGGF